jgi:hypothetical protein
MAVLPEIKFIKDLQIDPPAIASTSRGIKTRCRLIFAPLMYIDLKG